MTEDEEFEALEQRLNYKPVDKEDPKNKALKLALEALKELLEHNIEIARIHGHSDKEIAKGKKFIAARAAITAIREALAEQPAQVVEPVAWVDAGDLKQLRKGDVIRVIRKGETYYSPFRYCGVLEECDYEYYSESRQFVYLEVGMATVEKIVYTRKDFATGAVYADRGDKVEVAKVITAIREALAEESSGTEQPAQQEPVANELKLHIIRKWPEGFQDRLQHVWLDVVSFIPDVKLYDLQRVLAEFGFTMKVFEGEPPANANAGKPWVGLTDDQLNDLYAMHHDKFGQPISAGQNGWGYERAIEAKLREKNA